LSLLKKRSTRLAIEPLAEGRQVDPIWHEPDIGARAARGEVLAQGIAVIGAVRQQDVAAAERIQHVLCAAPIMGLAFGDLQKNWQTAGID